LLALSSAMVGNSSSGIMESTSLNLPAVNIGIRQQGREHGGNVLDASADADDITRKMRLALSPEFRERVRGVTNPYGDGCASARILQVLREVQLGPSLLMKAPLEVS
jgi:UDP-N-acetylglucosamine 2-epimerase